MVRIGKKYTFDAAHQLVGHKGKCANLHGHTYTVEVWVEGEVIDNPHLSDHGMVLDYGDLDEIVKPIIEELDHAFLIMGNERIWLEGSHFWKICNIGLRTTAENLAMWIHGRILSMLVRKDFLGGTGFPNVALLGVIVSETPKTYAEYVEKV